MPRAPSYNPATSGAAPVSARLQAPQFVESGLGQGLERAGQAVGQFASEMDAIQAQHDDTVARQQVLALQPQLSDQMTRFKVLQGGNAVDGRQQAIDGIAKLREQGASALKSPRAQRIFNERFGTMYAAAVGDINGHAIEQAAVQRKGVLGAELSDAQDAAAGLVNNPEELRAAVGIVGQKAQDYADFAGLGEASGRYVKEQQGMVYGSAIDRLVKDDNVDLAEAIFDAHHDEMTFEQRNRALDALREPMQRREDDAIFEAAAGGLTKAPSSQQAGRGHDTYQQPVAGGHISNSFAQHKERGSSGLDIAAPMGSAIHPIAGGIVEAVTQDNRAGRWVKVKHPDGTTSTYAHMGNWSVKVGDEVTPDTVLGTVGMTGHTTGPHVHLRVRDKSGTDLDPEKVISGRAGRGSIVGSTTAARNYDQAAVINNIKAMGLSPEREQRAIKRARQRMGEAETLLNDQYEDAADNLHTWIGNYQASHNGDDPPASVLPSSLTSRVKPSMLADLRGNLAKAEQAKYDKAAALERDNTGLGLNILAIERPDAFAKLKLGDYIGLVPAGDLASLAKKQAELHQNINQWSPDKAASSALSMFDARNPGLLPENPGPKKADAFAEYNRQRLAILQTMSAMFASMAKGGKIPSDDEMYRAAVSATKEIRFASGRTGRLYDLTIDNLSPQTIQNIRSILSRRGNSNPSDDDIMTAYRLQARDSQGR
jgi:murein DD-endopeptidase MepM/ murein hydrolase activator NlpD